MRALIAFVLLAGTTPIVAASPPATQSELYRIAGAVSAERLHKTISTLVGFGTRHTLSGRLGPHRGIVPARAWVRRRFEEISKACGGCLEVKEISDTVTGKRVPAPTRIVDVIAIQRGTADPGRYLVMTGHLDSRVSDVMNADAQREPGADDDGSGVAAVLEVARVLSQRKLGATVVYGVTSGEEQGLYGGKLLADYAARQGWQVEADLNNDIMGAVVGEDGVIDNTQVRVFSTGVPANATPALLDDLRFHGGLVDSPSREIARYTARLASTYFPHLHVMMVYRLDRFGRGGDQMAFYEHGFPAVRFTEPNEDYRHQHQDVRTDSGVAYGDTIDHVNFDYLAKATALNAVTLASLAQAPAPPREVSVNGAVQPSTTLAWQPGDSAAAKMAAGYEVRWRLTDVPRWTHRRWVGDVRTYTIADVVIDNYYFGVAAVSPEGYASPAVFPGPAGSFYATGSRR